MPVDAWKDHDDPSWDEETRKRMFAAYLGYLQGNGALPKSIKTKKFLGFIPYIPESEALKAYKMRNKLKLAAVLLLNQAKKAGEMPTMKPRSKQTSKAVEKPSGVAHVAPKGGDNKPKTAAERHAAHDLGFLKAALDLGLTGEKLNAFYKRAHQKLSAVPSAPGMADTTPYNDPERKPATAPAKAAPKAPAKPDPFAGYGLPTPATKPAGR